MGTTSPKLRGSRTPTYTATLDQPPFISKKLNIAALPSPQRPWPTMSDRFTVLWTLVMGHALAVLYSWTSNEQRFCRSGAAYYFPSSQNFIRKTILSARLPYQSMVTIPWVSPASADQRFIYNISSDRTKQRCSGSSKTLLPTYKELYVDDGNGNTTRTRRWITMIQQVAGIVFNTI